MFTLSRFKFNVAILGYGLSGSTFHAPIIATTPGLNLTHFLSRQADLIHTKYPNATVVNELADLINNPEIDLIINTLPNVQHYAISRRCLEGGKNLIIEKPFVINSQDGQELIALAKEKRLLLSVYHNRRWDNGYLTLKKHRKELGNIYLYEAYFDRFRPLVNPLKWREQATAGSGILYDLGSHLIDQALNLFGWPQAVFADLQIQRPKALAIDYFQIILYYQNLRVILGSSSIIASSRPIIAAYGDRGSYVKHGLDPQEDDLRAGKTPLTPDWGLEENKNSGILTTNTSSGLISQSLLSEAGCYQKYYQQIHAALASATPVPVEGVSATNVIKIIEHCLKSNISKQLIQLS